MVKRLVSDYDLNVLWYITHSNLSTRYIVQDFRATWPIFI